LRARFNHAKNREIDFGNCLLDRMGVLPSGFEPESKPREGFMIGHYTTGA
jgi:hypothetical protein